MSHQEQTANKVAELLLQIQAVKLNKKEPFTWASGWKSPIYCDNRKTLSYPQIRTYIRQEFANVIQEIYGDVDVIAGVATGAIANGALVAEQLGKPFVYVRPDKKKHGMGKRVHPSSITRHRRSWRRTKLHLTPRKQRKSHFG